MNRLIPTPSSSRLLLNRLLELLSEEELIRIEHRALRSGRGRLARLVAHELLKRTKAYERA